MLLIFVAVILCATSVAQATISKIVDDGICRIRTCTPADAYPLLLGKTVTVTLQGQYVDLATRVEVTGPAGVSAAGIGTATSSKTISLTVTSNAAPGVRTVKLRYFVETNGPDTFTVVVLRGGVINNVTFPTPTAPFVRLDGTITGTNLDNASFYSKRTGSGGNFIAVGDYQSTATQVIVQYHAQRGIEMRISEILRVFDNAGGQACELDARYCYQKASGGADISISVVGPNFVSRVHFVDGNGAILWTTQQKVVEENVLRIVVTLKEAAKSGGETVFWQITPATSFVSAAGSGTTYSSSGVNSVTMAGGQTTKELSVKLDRLPAGCPSQGCVGQVQAKTQAQAEYVIQTFQMIPGTISSPTNTPKIP
jgi:hypothetical protein